MLQEALQSCCTFVCFSQSWNDLKVQRLFGWIRIPIGWIKFELVLGTWLYLKITSLCFLVNICSFFLQCPKLPALFGLFIYVVFLTYQRQTIIYLFVCLFVSVYKCLINHRTFFNLTCRMSLLDVQLQSQLGSKWWHQLPICKSYKKLYSIKSTEVDIDLPLKQKV